MGNVRPSASFVCRLNSHVFVDAEYRKLLFPGSVLVNVWIGQPGTGPTTVTTYVTPLLSTAILGVTALLRGGGSVGFG